MISVADLQGLMFGAQHFQQLGDYTLYTLPETMGLTFTSFTIAVLKSSVKCE